MPVAPATVSRSGSERVLSGFGAARAGREPTAPKRPVGDRANSMGYYLFRDLLRVFLTCVARRPAAPGAPTTKRPGTGWLPGVRHTWRATATVRSGGGTAHADSHGGRCRASGRGGVRHDFAGLFTRSSALLAKRCSGSPAPLRAARSETSKACAASSNSFQSASNQPLILCSGCRVR